MNRTQNCERRNAFKRYTDIIHTERNIEQREKKEYKKKSANGWEREMRRLTCMYYDFMYAVQFIVVFEIVSNMLESKSIECESARRVSKSHISGRRGESTKRSKWITLIERVSEIDWMTLVLTYTFCSVANIFFPVRNFLVFFSRFDMSNPQK